MRAAIPLPGPLAAVLAALLGLLLPGADPAPPPVPDAVSGVDATKIPAPARDALQLIVDLTTTQCPELPPGWVVAQVQAESGWDAALTARAPGGAAGLYQFSQRNWQAAGGQAWASDPPDPDSDVASTEAHLRVAVPWVCANLRAATAHLEATGKQTAPLDAMLVCHVAGCGRVTGSATGIPTAGEAGCSERCAQLIRRYLHAVHANLERFAAAPPPPAAPVPPPPAAPAQPPAAPAPADAQSAAGAAAAPTAWTGGATGCRPPDPTGSGCVTGAARHGLAAAATAFGGWSNGSVIRSAGCWDKHAWNPRSDHPRGKACDLFVTAPGTFANGAEQEAGWRVADWFRQNAQPLQVKYLIWHGRYWDPRVKDDGGWGRRYTGGGVYNVRDASGGHFDHVHVSFQE